MANHEDRGAKLQSLSPFGRSRRCGVLRSPPMRKTATTRRTKNSPRHDPVAATRRLEEALGLAPQFAEAWNELGTIAYQTQNYARAEECFREALKQDSQAFEPLVNLGGVLVTVHRADEAWQYNARAVALRPNDALAHSQLGMNYYQLGDLGLSVN